MSDYRKNQSVSSTGRTAFLPI